MATADRVRVGASGYSFKDWKGVFYPETLSSVRLLEYYSGVFDVVEINVTYYRIPPAKTFEKMLGSTDEEFGFVVKLHGSMTHEREGNLQPFDDFLAAIRPLEESGRLIGLLAQFPSGFRNDADSRSYLDWVRRKFERFRFFAEFRHDSWAGDGIFDWLRGLGIGYCCVDEPQLKGLMPPVAEATGEIGYVRFHGRNAADWWRPRPGSDRYLYDYSERELREWAQKVERLAAGCEQVLLFFNNCHFGNAPKNAKTMKKLLGIPETRRRKAGELEL